MFSFITDCFSKKKLKFKKCKLKNRKVNNKNLQNPFEFLEKQMEIINNLNIKPCEPLYRYKVIFENEIKPSAPPFEEEECCICLGKMKYFHDIKKFKCCNNSVHKSCFIKLRSYSKNCPLCREKI